MASTDVLCTGEGGDLVLTDVVVRTDQSIALVMQQLEIALLTGRGEYLLDSRQGINWLGFLTARRVDTRALSAEIREAVGIIPEVSVVDVQVATQGQVFTIGLDLRYNRTRVAVQLLIDPAAMPLGNDRAFAFSYFVT
jgi:hypothetical protein